MKAESMPTISEPAGEPFRPASWPPSVDTLRGHLEAIKLDLLDRGIRPTPQNIMAFATDEGVPDAIAAQIAGLINEV